MADEIPGANVIRIVRDGATWLATIGPDAARGVVGQGSTPLVALHDLAGRCERGDWCFDPTWRPAEPGKAERVADELYDRFLRNGQIGGSR